MCLNFQFFVLILYFCPNPQVVVSFLSPNFLQVFPEGLVASDGRLQPGDQIIEINGADMTCATHAQVSYGFDDAGRLGGDIVVSWHFMLIKRWIDHGLA